MNEARILKALLFITQEAGGLAPGQLGTYLGKLRKAGYMTSELRKVDGCQLPHWILTDEGKAKL
jgi:hypothetical protein